MNARRGILYVLIGIVLGVLGVLTARYWPWFPSPASTRAVEVDRLFRVFLGFAAAIFFLVEGLLVYAIFRFRRQSGDSGEGPPVHSNLALEVLWTALPAILVAYLGLYSFQVLQRVEAAAPEARVVRVISKQFQWSFYYPEADVLATELHLPVNEPVRFEIESEDVIHSFWVPEWRTKRDATPGQISELLITPSQSGTFPIRCAELCGAGHAAMINQVVVESQADFEAWLAAQAESDS